MNKSPPQANKSPRAGQERSRIASGFDRIMFSEFYLLEEHRAFVEKHFADTLAKFEKKFEEESSRATESDHWEMYEGHLVDEYQKLANDLPRLQWHAQFLVAFSTFENALNELCRIVQRRSGHSLSFKDISGSGIVRASNYLIKVSGVIAPFQTADWHRSRLLMDIRNAITHSNGEIEYNLTDPGSLAYRTHKLGGLELQSHFDDSSSADIILSPDFVRDAIASLCNVVNDVANYELYQGGS